jgi:hypothetical protein
MNKIENIVNELEKKLGNEVTKHRSVIVDSIKAIIKKLPVGVTEEAYLELVQKQMELLK